MLNSEFENIIEQMQNKARRNNNNKILGILAIIGLVVVFAVLLIVGLPLITSLIFVVLLLIMLIVSPFMILPSFISAFLLNYFAPELKEVLGFWTDSTALFQTIDYLHDMGVIKLTAFFFTVTYIVKFFTGSIRIFRISSSSTSESKE